MRTPEWAEETAGASCAPHPNSHLRRHWWELASYGLRCAESRCSLNPSGKHQSPPQPQAADPSTGSAVRSTAPPALCSALNPGGPAPGPGRGALGPLCPLGRLRVTGERPCRAGHPPRG
eukprot:14814005-Alexandrium_andersonii.AAC.1